MKTAPKDAPKTAESEAVTGKSTLVAEQSGPVPSDSLAGDAPVTHGVEQGAASCESASIAPIAAELPQELPQSAEALVARATTRTARSSDEAWMDIAVDLAAKRWRPCSDCRGAGQRFCESAQTCWGKA